MKLNDCKKQVEQPAQADVIGGLTIQKALELLGLKEGVSLKEAKSAYSLFKMPSA